MQSSLEDAIRDYLPKYLSPHKSRELVSELSKFKLGSMNYYLRVPPTDNVLQGDSWSGLAFFNPRSGMSSNAKGLVLSNSCDVNPENDHATKRNIVFTPLLSLEKYYKTLLQSHNHDEARVNDIVSGIRRQEQTRLFYLPAKGEVIPESIALLDNLSIHPLENFSVESNDLLCRLSDAGHYVFTIKLAIHFTRVFEGESRSGRPDDDSQSWFRSIIERFSPF